MTPDTPTEVTISPIVTPAVTPEQAKEAWTKYQELKKAIIDPKEDIQHVSGRAFLTKSYWRKVATFFNLSVEVTAEKQETLESGEIIFHFTCKATAPNGRAVSGTGSCGTREKGGRENTIHNARTTAETRAWNRAVSNLVGGGEPSAEEAGSDEAYPSRQANSYPQSSAPKAPNAFELINKEIQGLDTQNLADVAALDDKIANHPTLTAKQKSYLKDILTKRLDS